MGLLTAVAGTVLFAWLVWSVGPAEIWTGIQQIGWGLVVDPHPRRPALRGARRGVGAVHRAAAHAAASAKRSTRSSAATRWATRRRSARSSASRRRSRACADASPSAPALTALAIENVIYTLSVAAMIAAGAIALLVSACGPVAGSTAQLREFSEVAIAGIVVLFVAAAWVLWRRPAVVGHVASGSRAPEASRIAQAARPRAARSSLSRRGGAARWCRLSRWSCGSTRSGVTEKHLTLWLILGSPPPLMTSFIVETADRLITVAFKFVPFQVGVGEAGTGLITQLLGLGPAPGVTVSIVRKARMGIWSLVGTALLVRRGLTARRVLAEDSPN